MMTMSREKTACIAEIKTYNGKLLTPERQMDLHLLSQELGSEYKVKWWTFGKHIRVAVIKDGVLL